MQLNKISKRSLRIQTVLYGNDTEDLKRSFLNLVGAAKLAKKINLLDEIEMVYGDCSQTPLFSEDELENIKKLEDSSGVDKVIYEFFDENLGSAAGQNKLLKKSQSKFLLIINPDVVVAPNVFIELVNTFNNIPKAGIIEARQIPIEHPKDYDAATGETSWISTACALTTTEIAMSVSGFDSESFFLYCDDVDFSWRVKIAGYKLIFQPSAIIFHDKRLTDNAQQLPSSAEVYYSAEAALMLAHKYSRPDLVNIFSKNFLINGNETQKKALSEFKIKLDSGLLPKPIDKNHKVAQFMDGNYAKHRF